MADTEAIAAQSPLEQAPPDTEAAPSRDELKQQQLEHDRAAYEREGQKAREVALQAGKLALSLEKLSPPGTIEFKDNPNPHLSYPGAKAEISDLVPIDPLVTAEAVRPMSAKLFVTYTKRPGRTRLQRLLGAGEAEPKEEEILKVHHVGLHRYTEAGADQEPRFHSTQRWGDGAHSRLVDAELTLNVLEAVAARLQETAEAEETT
jgi:hypothetical protein